jgi:hypothetical protein
MVPTEEEPIIEVGDEIHVNIGNLSNPETSSNPVYIFRNSNFNVDQDGDFIIKYNTGAKKIGRVNEENEFVLEPGFVLRKPLDIFLTSARGPRYDTPIPFFKRPIPVKPENIIIIPKTKMGTFETVGLPLEKYEGQGVTPLLNEDLDILTMDQIKMYIQHSPNFDIENTSNVLPSRLKTVGSVHRLLNMGLYLIYDTDKMYTSCEFLRAVFKNPRKKKEGYLVFRKSSPIRKQQLRELTGVIEDFESFPEDNPKSIVGKKYREEKTAFEEKHGQKFLEKENFENAMKELRQNFVKMVTGLRAASKTRRSAKKQHKRVLSEIRGLRKTRRSRSSSSRSP